MDLLLVTTILVGGLTALGLAAARFGIDSRDASPRDQRR